MSQLWQLGAALGLLIAANAAPAIDVSVRAAFPAPPLLLELLETAADENATAYFPILDQIAAGRFDAAKSDAELYRQFRSFLKTDGHLSQDEDLSSFDLALSLHTTAPRIEAQYQYYNTTIRPSLTPEEEASWESWVHAPFIDSKTGSATFEHNDGASATGIRHTAELLPFDRVLGETSTKEAGILYADLTTTSFRQQHSTLVEAARKGLTSYRLRYKPPKGQHGNPLAVSGYGVQLALKRTDYIVIDDREDGAEPRQKSAAATELSEGDEVADLKPLSASEVRGLGHKAATFVLASKDPLDTLLKLTQDFPKHSSSIAATNISIDFSVEHTDNRQIVLPAGYNVVWINGVQIMPRDMDVYALLEHLRRERKFIESVRDLGLTGSQAVDLLTHEAITNAQVDQDVPRYDWRDEIEGGNVIIWLNDLEKDKRYSDWTGNVRGLLQRTYPGQLPPVARDVHNLVVSVDFSNFAEVQEVVESMQAFVKRRIPIRFGLVPTVASSASEQQAKIAYHLSDTYGLGAVLNYLEQSLIQAGRKHSAPDPTAFARATSDAKLRRNKSALSLQEIVRTDDANKKIAAARAYAERLFSGSPSTVLANGAVLAKTEDWIQSMSQRVTMDTRLVQQYVYEQSLDDDAYVPQLFLETAGLRRNALIIPEDDNVLRHVNVGELPFHELPKVPWSAGTVDSELVFLIVAADIDTEGGFQLLAEAIAFKKDHENVELALLHTPDLSVSSADRILSKLDPQTVLPVVTIALAQAAGKHAEASTAGDVVEAVWRIARSGILEKGAKGDHPDRGTWDFFAAIAAAIGLRPGQKAVVLNGRVVGPFDSAVPLSADDLDTVLAYERKKRLTPAALTIESMGLKELAKEPLAFAKISNLIARSLVSDVPEGYFDSPPTVRTSMYNKWATTHTSFSIGDSTKSSIQVVAAIDPASETAQMWVPILKVLSELEGVSVRIFLNPKDRLEELPVKRFYRYVAGAKPEFTADGTVVQHSARFSGLPADALLNIGMDIPPAWLVAPKESVHDLDNIKLSAVKSGADITAIYELEHILIEGHSRDTTVGQAPRGVRLVLGTDSDSHVADTIIMANLGYFQFKANPGIYDLALQKGRSEEIFVIDSAGTKGYSPQPGDNGTEIALMSFRGATLYPRLSRKPGMEEEDVLAASKSTITNLADKADKLLANAGLTGKGSGKVLSNAASKLFSRSGVSKTASKQADINIFSVASGHLYERMLNIMMLSVMKHTKHSVKFWFIEQFLSPSFKTFLPALAEEYGFQYEMVTYKWPHWLRAQKEKQREIWGYKILFLDVLFPLDLDKVIFVDADQIVRTDMYELVQHDLEGAPYGFTPMCDSRTEMEGFRFWKQGYWKNYLRGLPYHISALYVVDLKAFREMAAGDRLRQQYHTLSADPNSLSNLDQDLPNHMQMALPIHSLPQDWLWCETWCSDEALKTAKTIDLCNNPQTKEPKLDRARRQVPEWTVYDDEIAAVAKRHRESTAAGKPIAGNASDAGPQGEEEVSVQEELQRQDAERDRRKIHDEL